MPAQSSYETNSIILESQTACRSDQHDHPSLPAFLFQGSPLLFPRPSVFSLLSLSSCPQIRGVTYALANLRKFDASSEYHDAEQAFREALEQWHDGFAGEKTKEQFHAAQDDNARAAACAEAVLAC